MAWGKEWPKIEIIPPANLIDQYWSNGSLTFKQMTVDEFKAIYGKKPNLPPTHDPYTNPNSQIYYQCNCGAILDPGTKSFAALNNAASNAGWKVRWDEKSYIPYCVECGKDVE